MIAQRERQARQSAVLRGLVSPAEAAAMGRLAPIDRDICDGILYGLTGFSADRAHLDMFTGTFGEFVRLMQSSMWRPPPMMAPHVVDALVLAGSRFRRREPGEPVVDGHMTAAHQRDLAEELVYSLDGGSCGSLRDAGSRLYSKLVSAGPGACPDALGHQSFEWLAGYRCD